MLWTAFVMGLVGSLHCAGMCGPIALALPGGFRSRMALLSSRLLYNLGRVLTYSLLGGIWGLLGHGIALAGYQQGLSIGLGVLLLIMAFFSFRSSEYIARIPFFERMLQQVKRQLGRLLRVNSQSSLFLIGLLNGLLPCGLVYLALAGAVATGNFAQGAAFMAFFGLGTFPMMLAAALAGGALLPRVRNRLKPALALVTLMFACLLIVRGLNLGIPYLSPELTPAQDEITVCE